MTTTEPTTLLRTPFHQFHADQGAKLVEFAGWEMPMLYDSIIEEHRQVRSSGGLFDVSHMGRVRFSGRGARRFLDTACSRKIHGMADGQVRYSLVCNESGGCRDDVLVYRLADEEYLMVCNAANRVKLLSHFEAIRGELDFDLRDETVGSAMLALQGPKVMDMIGQFAPEVLALKRYRFVRKDVFGAPVLISRTGYTGEDGVEVILPAALAAQAMMLLVTNLGGADAPVKPAGLGARDTLRLEAGMPLYGHEITEELDPLSAGLTFAVKIDKGDDDPEVGHFIGQEALRKIAEQGPKQRLMGLILEGRRTARAGMKVRSGDTGVGFVTSGCLSPTLGKPIAMAYVERSHANAGGSVDVLLGSAGVRAEVVELPFYKRG